jgi:hypothetical protein
MRFGALFVAERIKDGWIRRMALGGDVEIRCDVKMGAAFEYDLLDVVAVPLQRADDTGIERRALGLAAEIGQHAFAHQVAAAEQIGAAIDGGDSRLTLVEFGFRQPFEVAGQHRMRLVQH